LKLLFDENLSFRLVAELRAEYPGSQHISKVMQSGATDEAIWKYARDNDFAITSKDDDFRSMSLVRGAPPKVVVLRIGNSSTDSIASLLQHSAAQLRRFDNDASESILILGRTF
jgi:predicted nuclease of predicted toxin-antitoxin system